MHYTLHQLNVFLKIAQNSSITKASKELHLSQPAVSIQLKNFQDQFDIPLTEVIRRKLYLTDFGKEISIAAEKILEQVEAINYKSLAYKGELTGRLKLSIVSTGKYVIPFFLTDFLKQNQGVNLIMDVTNKTKVVESLEANEVDFSLVSVLPENLEINRVELMQNQLFLVANSDAKFNKKKYDLRILETLPIIYREQGSGTRYVMEKFIEQNNLVVRKKLELTSNEAVKQAIIAGLGCSIMPIIGIKNEIMNGELQIINVKGFPIKSTWQLIWLKNKRLSPVAQSFLNYLNLEKNNIMQSKFNWLKISYQ